MHPDSRLALAVKGRGEPGRYLLDAVLSMHHQAVETLVPGLLASATAPDGVIEACEDASPVRWWVATQFHPEWSAQLSWVVGLFTTFVDASRAYSAVPREEIDPLRCEIKEWMRQRDHYSTPFTTTTTLTSTSVASEPSTTPLSRNTFTLLHPVREAV